MNMKKRLADGDVKKQRYGLKSMFKRKIVCGEPVET